MLGSLQRFYEDECLLYVWRARVRGKSEVLLMFVEMHHIRGRRPLWRHSNVRPAPTVTFKLRFYQNGLGIIWGKGSWGFASFSRSIFFFSFYLFYRWIPHDISQGTKRRPLVFENHLAEGSHADIPKHDSSPKCYPKSCSHPCLLCCCPMVHTPALGPASLLLVQSPWPAGSSEAGCRTIRSSKSPNNWYSSEGYFYASCSLSEDIFGPFLGNKEIPLLSRLLPGGAEDNKQRSFGKRIRWEWGDQRTGIFWSSQEWSDVCSAAFFFF